MPRPLGRQREEDAVGEIHTGQLPRAQSWWRTVGHTRGTKGKRPEQGCFHLPFLDSYSGSQVALSSHEGGEDDVLVSYSCCNRL